MAGGRQAQVAGGRQAQPAEEWPVCFDRHEGCQGAAADGRDVDNLSNFRLSDLCVDSNHVDFDGASLDTRPLHTPGLSHNC